MFTADQSLAMQYIAMSPIDQRDNLSSPANLQLTGITSPGTGCVPLIEIAALPASSTCSGNSLTLQSYTHNADPATYAWSATTGAVISNPSASVTAVYFPAPGNYAITCVVTNSAGSNADTKTVFIANGAIQVNKVYAESFEENNNALPPNWNVITSFNQGWRVSSLAGSEGARSIYVAGDSIPPGITTILETPSYDFKSMPVAVFNFKWAYARKSQVSKDVFMIQATKDCGGTWTTVWWPNTTLLANSSGGIKSTAFIPSAGHWQLKELTENSAFTPFLNEKNVKLRFIFQVDPEGWSYGNRFYLDEINFAKPVGISEFRREADFNLYPVPASDMLHLEFNSADLSPVEVQIHSADGSLVSRDTYQKRSGANISIPTSRLIPGIYFLTTTVKGGSCTKKFIRE
jgi:hypothetical protein